MRTKPQVPDPEVDTNFKGRCSHLEGYIFNIGPRSLEKLDRIMKDLELYLGANYIDRCQPATMTETSTTFPGPYMPKTIPDMVVERRKMDVDMAYLKIRVL